MRFLRTSLLSITALSLLLSTFTSCKKEGDTIVQTKTHFALGVNYSPEERGKLRISFSTTEMSVVPEVKVNNVKLTDIEFSNGISMSGTIDSTKTVTFSVTANGKTTSGEIIVPKAPEVININSTVPNPSSSYYNYIYLAEATKYTLKYSATDASEYKLYFYDYDNELRTTKYTTGATSYDLSGRYGYLYLYGINGFNIETGTKPNVTGDYGDGYVISISESKELNIRRAEDYKKSAPIQTANQSNVIFEEVVKMMNSK